MLNDFENVQIYKINGVISEKKQGLKEEVNQLMEKVQLLQKQIENYSILQDRIDEIVKIVNASMKTISLFELVSEDATMMNLLSKKIKGLTLGEVVGDVDIDTWIDSRLEIIKKDMEKSNLLCSYQNRTAIKDLKVYDATLKVMYNRQNRSDVFRVAMDYLVNNSVVERNFSVNDLIQDFKNYREMQKMI